MVLEAEKIPMRFGSFVVRISSLHAASWRTGMWFEEERDATATRARIQPEKKAREVARAHQKLLKKEREVKGKAMGIPWGIPSAAFAGSRPCARNLKITP